MLESIYSQLILLCYRFGEHLVPDIGITDQESSPLLHNHAGNETTAKW